MNILDNAKSHFKTRLDLRGPILVPEWGDGETPAEVFYKVPNMLTRSKMAKALDEDGLEGIVTVLILMALDANGEPMFKMPNRVELMRSVDPEIIQRITGEMDTRNPDMGES